LLHIGQPRRLIVLQEPEVVSAGGQDLDRHLLWMDGLGAGPVAVAVTSVQFTLAARDLDMIKCVRRL
jgi:hypothetical protein